MSVLKKSVQAQMTPSTGWNGKSEEFQCAITTKRDFFLKKEMDDLVLTEARKFEYQGLPVNLPAFELERRLIMQGYAPIYKHTVYGIVTLWGARSGVGIYDNATRFTGAQRALGTVDFEDGVGGIIAYNTSLDKSYQSSSVIARRLIYYANILADIDLSLWIISVNGRAMNTVGAKTDNAVNTIQQWYDALTKGETFVPLLETGVFQDVVPMISKDCADARGLVNELLAMKSDFKKQFYNQAGVMYMQRKAERMNVDEVEVDEDMLSINIFDQLACRAEAIAKMNALYDTNASVRVNNLVIT